MKQAIEEGFILDVLKNYTRINCTTSSKRKSLTTLPSEDKGMKALARWATLHPIIFAKDRTHH